MELAREEYKSMLDEMTADKQSIIDKLRDEKTNLKSTQLQLSDLRAEHQALARDCAAMEAELTASQAKVQDLERQLVDGSSSLTEQVNELKYQLVHAKADKEEVITKAEHDKAKMYGILKELEQQLREATGGDPSSNLMAKMSEFTDTMGGAAPSSGSLSAALQEYKEKLDLAQQENTALRAQLNAS